MKLRVLIPSVVCFRTQNRQEVSKLCPNQMESREPSRGEALLMTELAIYGQFKQVPQVLWFRRWYGRIFSLGRQRANFFPGRRPLYMYAPWWMAHGVSLFWTLGVEGRGAPAVSKLAGSILAIRYLAFSGLFHFWQSMRAVRGYSSS